MTQGRFIDLDRWKRREHFAAYRALAYPFWSVTVDVDVTRVWGAAAREERSFFLATSFAALTAANETEAFRLRIRSDGIWCHDAVSLSTTVLRSDETFAFAVLRPQASFAAFEADAKAVMARAQSGADLGMPPAGVDDLIYHSSLPWIRFTSFTNALGGKDDCIPRLVFGRAMQEGAVCRMPVAVEVHHGLVDGLDVARFLERLQQRLEKTESTE